MRKEVYDGKLAGIFAGCYVTYVIEDQMKMLAIRMHKIIHSCMKSLTNMRYFYVVESGVCSRQKYLHTQCTSAIRMKHIIHMINFEVFIMW